MASSYFFVSHKQALQPELCNALIAYYDKAPVHCHLGKIQEGDSFRGKGQKRLSSCSLEITNNQSNRLVGRKLRTELENVINKTKVLDSLGLGPGKRRFRRFTLRKYSPEDRPGVGWHIDATEAAIIIFLGDPGSFEGGTLRFGQDENTQRVVNTENQEKGTMIVFEGCNVYHSVDDVTKGARYAAVLFLNRHVARNCTVEKAKVLKEKKTTNNKKRKK